MILITSGSYVEQELKSIFGNIPPSFLPVQNRRLFYHQSKLFPDQILKYITLPECFIVDEQDIIDLKGLNFEIIYVPENLSLGESIKKAITSVGKYEESLHILHGDTYFDSIPIDKFNFYSIGEISYNYNWAKLDEGIYRNKTYSGYFSFSDVNLLIESLVKEKYNFEAALDYYNKHTKVEMISLKNWLDFGHANTYFRSKSNFTSERAFNKIISNKLSFTKSSIQIQKIKAEYKWYKNLKPELQLHTPHVFNLKINDEKAEYSLEYLNLATLNELLVFGKLPNFVWKKIFQESISFLENLSLNNETIAEGSYSEQIKSKTFIRLKNLDYSSINPTVKNLYNGISLPSLFEISENTSFYLNDIYFSKKSIMHGDFCFSNILYDFRSQSIKVIDPRGIDFENNISNEGYLIYDLAKYFHSIIGLYDFIIAGNYKVECDNNNKFNFDIYRPDYIKEIQNQFLKTKINGISINQKSIFATMIHLFLSMLPLHKDDKKRQQALAANALRLYLDFIN